MSEIEKEFLSQTYPFQRLSLKLGKDSEKRWFNLMYLAVKTRKIKDLNSNEEKVALNYLWRDLTDGEYYTVLTTSFTLIGGLKDADVGSVFNLTARRKTIAQNRWAISYEVELLPKRQELSDLDKEKIAIFLEDEPVRKRIPEETEQEEFLID
ncbi:MAG: hypothetical protein KatS3mg096_806 [Candidatus Parcubacteria bacterium]|nr:MAG: hypothetical protein KatS3mg096_806 [Candidatus Parcubacteria bacterium]